MKISDVVFSNVTSLRFYSQPDLNTIWTAIDPNTLENDYGFDDAQSPYQFDEFRKNQRVGIILDFTKGFDGITYAKISLDAIHHDDGHDAVWFFGTSTPKRERPFVIEAWVRADDVVDGAGIVKEYVPASPPPKQAPAVTLPVTPPAITPLVGGATPKTETPKVDNPQTVTKTIFTQTDANGTKTTNWLMVGGVGTAVILVFVGIYFIFFNKPEPQAMMAQPYGQPLPNSQPIAQPVALK